MATRNNVIRSTQTRRFNDGVLQNFIIKFKGNNFSGIIRTMFVTDGGGRFSEQMTLAIANGTIGNNATQVTDSFSTTTLNSWGVGYSSGDEQIVMQIQTNNGGDACEAFIQWEFTQFPDSI